MPFVSGKSTRYSSRGGGCTGGAFARPTTCSTVTPRTNALSVTRLQDTRRARPCRGQCTQWSPQRLSKPPSLRWTVITDRQHHTQPQAMHSQKMCSRSFLICVPRVRGQILRSAQRRGADLVTRPTVLGCRCRRPRLLAEILRPESLLLTLGPWRARPAIVLRNPAPALPWSARRTAGWQRPRS
jgi:hypothetical protein